MSQYNSKTDFLALKFSSYASFSESSQAQKFKVILPRALNYFMQKRKISNKSDDQSFSAKTSSK